MRKNSLTHHLTLAKYYWANFLKKGDIVIDATCGNGKDTLFLAELVLLERKGYVFAYDIQKKAIENTKKLLQEDLSDKLMKRITLLEKNHEDFSDIPKEPIRLIAYNLGYLPLSDKSIVTQTNSTLKSIQNALRLTNGAISIMCYPGHEEGLREQKAVMEFLETLDPENWSVQVHSKLNQPKAPCFLWITKKTI